MASSISAEGKRKPAPARKPKAAAKSVTTALPPTPQSAARPSNSYELESPSPALAHQGKVRRMRESPFHKGSGSSSLPAVEEVSGVLSYPKVRHLFPFTFVLMNPNPYKKSYVIPSTSVYIMSLFLIRVQQKSNKLSVCRAPNLLWLQSQWHGHDALQ